MGRAHLFLLDALTLLSSWIEGKKAKGHVSSQEERKKLHYGLGLLYPAALWGLFPCPESVLHITGAPKANQGQVKLQSQTHPAPCLLLSCWNKGLG